jgi:hypothetical protein
MGAVGIASGVGAGAAAGGVVGAGAAPVPAS